jgi:hypothetical protein
LFQSREDRTALVFDRIPLLSSQWASITAGLTLLAARASAELFVTPIGGVPYEDWTIVNYVDLDPGPGIRSFALRWA